MNIGLIIAIEREMMSFLAHGKDIETIEISRKKVYKTEISGKTIYALKSGYGQIDAAAATQLLISHFNCEIILNFGVTGALESGLKVEDLFLVEKCRNYLFDVSPIDPVKFNQYEEFEDEFIPLDKDLYNQAKAALPNLINGVVASGDKFVDKLEDKKYLNSLGCNICDMEISAIARTCYICGVRCLSIKCISDTLEGDGGDFNTNVIRSASVAFSTLLKVIENLKI